MAPPSLPLPLLVLVLVLLLQAAVPSATENSACATRHRPSASVKSLVETAAELSAADQHAQAAETLHSMLRFVKSRKRAVQIRQLLAEALLRAGRPADALAQFAAAARINRNTAPAGAAMAPSGYPRRWVDDDSPEWVNATASALELSALRKAVQSGEPPPPGHHQDMFHLPRRLGHIETRGPGEEVELYPSAREIFEHYAPGGALSFRSQACSYAVVAACGTALVHCDVQCMRQCTSDRRKLFAILQGCARMATGKPVVLKGAAKTMPAYQMWQSKNPLSQLDADHAVEVEIGKKETRKGAVGDIPLRQFWRDMEAGADVYSVGEPTAKMKSTTHLPPQLTCGGYIDRLSAATSWLSSGGTKSVVHKDGTDNMNCLFAGRKRMIMWHPKYEKLIETAEFGWVDHQHDPDGERYGSYAGAFQEEGSINVEKMDLVKFPGWSLLEWWDAELEAGDCLFLPVGWYHHVESAGEEGLNFGLNLWWHRLEELDVSELDETNVTGCPSLRQPVKVSDCTFDEEVESGKITTGCDICRVPSE